MQDPSAEPGATAAPRRYREVTLSAIIFGIIFGAIMNASITYAGLKIGFTIVGSAIAAVLGFGVLRGLLRKGSILETNIGQTIASAVNTPNSGVIFTVPVLLLLGYQLSIGEADFWLLTLACVAGAILGCAFIIPLRKQMIDIDRLRFPEGTAVGAILKSPGAGAKKSIVLVVGIILGALIFLPTALPDIRVTAGLNELDRLVESEKIGQADADLTMEIAAWIDAGAAPEAVVERGRLLTESEASETRAEKRALREQAEAIDLAPGVSAGKPDLFMAAYEAAQGERDWASLQDRKLGWASKPMWGYADLNLRMADERGEDGQLTRRVDRDQNGHADLLIDNHNVDVGRFLGLPPEILFVFAITPLSLGAGYLSGKPGLLVLAGGVLAYFVLNPILFNLNMMPATVDAPSAPGFGFTNFNRPLGIGLLLGGAMMGVVKSLPAIKEAMKSIGAAGKTAGGSDELGLKTLTIAAIAALLILFVAADFTESQPLNLVDPVSQQELEEVGAETRVDGYLIAFESEENLATWTNWDDAQRQGFMDSLNAKPGLLSGLNTHVRSALIAVIGAIWIWFAGIIIAQCTGMTDWSPISGMALLTIVLVMLLAGAGDVMGAVLIGATLCVAITCAADMMADLKTGYIVGAMPKRQQICELIATGAGPLITMATILLIAQVNMAKVGVPMGPGTETTAPQAQALQAVITGVQGGQMPYALYGGGAILGVLLGLGSFAGLGVLVGLSMYLPIVYILTYGIGCVLNMLISKVKGKRWAEEWGVPMAAGLIVGEAMLALGVNFTILLRG
ncbi:MAG: OPT/YSL family transporter [Phycisphaerales bacterium]